jgi:DNA-binding transcriptional MerR regulator
MFSQYSIKELEHLSGIKAHTLRIWEQRYGVLTPKRTETNIRYYTDEDLKRILNIALLNKMGLRIGQISLMNDAEINEAIACHSTTCDMHYELHINDLTHAMIALDELYFEKKINTCILQHGLFATMLKVVYPFLEKIGVMWMTGNINPAQEHFISNLIRQKLIVAIDGQIVSYNEKSKHYLLFLPDGELHELSLLFLCFVLKSNNHKVTYLGASVPTKDVAAVIEYTKPQYVYTIFTYSKPINAVKKYISELANVANKQQIVVSGQLLEKCSFQFPENVNIVQDFNKHLAHFV